MRAGELLSAIGANAPNEIDSIEVTAIVTDSKKAIKNCIFICLEGSKYDGHDYIHDAQKAGAAVIVAEKVRDVCVGGAAILYVENTRRAASLLYNAWYGYPTRDIKTVGVTGTNGKTSTAFMTYRIFENAGYRCGFIGTIGAFSAFGRELEKSGTMTTPDPQTLYSTLAQMRDDGVEYLFMEVSSHALAQCRTDAVEFDVAVFTNLTEDHLDFHKNMEEYYLAKQKLFEQTTRSIVNIDDAYGKRLASFLEGKGGTFETCSLEKGDFCALSPKSGERGVEYELRCKKGSYRVVLPLSGEFQIMNSLEAAAVAVSCGVNADSVLKSINSMDDIPGRMESLKRYSEQDFSIFIDYAHTPDALEKLLLSARALRRGSGRIILLFGCGGEREKEKRRLMGQIASRLADVVIVTSDNPRGEDADVIIKDILKGIDKEKEYAVIKDRREAIERAVLEYAREGDILLLAGKGHERYQIDAFGMHEFDERKIVDNALRLRYH